MTLASAQDFTRTKDRTRSSLSAGLEKNLHAYAIAAGSAGVALLACVQPAEAKVIFTKTHIVVHPDKGLVQFDINGDGQNDFGLSAIVDGGSCTFTQARAKHPDERPPLGCPFDDRVKAVPAQAANEIWQQAVSYGPPCAAAVGKGAPINGKRPFGTGAMSMYVNSGTSEGHQYCAWSPKNSNPYLGVKFLDTEGQVHYGWVRVTIRDFRPVINGYAYETVPNKTIVAGATSGDDDESSLINPADTLLPKTVQPATLGHLALGVSGITAWRREEEVLA